MPPDSIKAPIRDHLGGVKRLREAALAVGRGAYFYRTPWTGSARTHRLCGVGSGYYPISVVGGIAGPERRVDTTSTRRWCSVRF